MKAASTRRIAPLLLAYLAIVSYTVLLSDQLHTLNKACFLSKDPECRSFENGGSATDPNSINTLNHGGSTTTTSPSTAPGGPAPGSPTPGSGGQPPVPPDLMPYPSQNYTQDDT